MTRPAVIDGRAPGLRRLVRDARGANAMEFGLIAPVLVLLLLGILEVGYQAYVTAVVQGAVQKAARDASLQTNNSTTAAAALDLRVKQQIAALGMNLPVPTITRRFFRDYNKAAAQAFETFTDSNDNKRCDANEEYTDTNGNGVWDADGGDAGTGGAQDRQVYTVSLSYDRLTPLWNFVPGVAQSQKVTAVTVLSNQPYADQAVYDKPVVKRRCP